MSEPGASAMGVRIFAIVLGVLGVLQFRAGNIVEAIISVAAIVFAVGLLFKFRWALIGACLTLLAATVVYFTEMVYLSIVDEDPGHIVPNLLKLIVSVLLFIYIGRNRVELDVFSRHPAS